MSGQCYYSAQPGYGALFHGQVCLEVFLFGLLETLEAAEKKIDHFLNASLRTGLQK